jgi:hypothetical protein
MTEQGRQESGKFAAKSEEIRQVRTIRLTDTAWDKLGEWADSQGMSKADFLEDLVKTDILSIKQEIKSLQEKIFQIESVNIDSICLSIELLQKVDKAAFLSRITRIELIEKIINSDYFNQLLKPLKPSSSIGITELAKRLGVDPKTIRDYRDGKRKTSLIEWSKTKTIDGKGWEYSPETESYFQVDA